MSPKNQVPDFIRNNLDGITARKLIRKLDQEIDQMKDISTLTNEFPILGYSVV